MTSSSASTPPSRKRRLFLRWPFLLGVVAVIGYGVVFAMHWDDRGLLWVKERFETTGERSESIALARQFRDFAALTADETFEGWCETLYRPLFNAPWQALGNPESGA